MSDPFKGFDEFFDMIGRDPFEMRSPVAVTRYTATVDRDEEGTDLIRVPLPGLTSGEVKVHVEDGMLYVQAEAGEGNVNAHFHSKKTHAWRLDRDHDVDNITAKMEDGVLTVKVPTHEKEVRQITID